MMTPRIFICLSASNAWYGRLIRWATGSKVNHSFIKHEDPFWGGWRATEIDEEGPHDKPITSLERIDYLEHWECSIDLFEATQSMAKFVGTAGYDWRGLLWGLVRSIWMKITGRALTEAAHSRSRWFCSEFVAEILIRAKIPGTENWEPANVSPGMLRKFFTKSSNFNLNTDPSKEHRS